MSDDLRDLARDMAILSTRESAEKSEETLREIAAALKEQNAQAKREAGARRRTRRCPHCGNSANIGFRTCPSCLEAISWVDDIPVLPGGEAAEKKRQAAVASRRQKERKLRTEVAADAANKQKQADEAAKKETAERLLDTRVELGKVFVAKILLPGVKAAIVLSAIAGLVKLFVGDPAFSFGIGISLVGIPFLLFIGIPHLFKVFARPLRILRQREKARKYLAGLPAGSSGTPTALEKRGEASGKEVEKKGPKLNQVFQNGAQAIGMDAKVGAGWQGASLTKQQLLLDGKPVEGTWSEIVREVYTRIYVQVLQRPADSRELRNSKTSKTLVDRINEFLDTTGTPGRSKTVAMALIRLGELAGSGKLKEAATQYHQRVWQSPIE